MENVTIITVTYGNRFHYLKEVIESVIFEKIVYKLIIVNNGSIPEYQRLLTKIEQEHQDKIKLINLERNSGAGHGFKTGIKEALSNNNCQFIWLLDDDNKPMNNTLSYLINVWQKTKMNNKEKFLCLLPVRFFFNANKKILPFYPLIKYFNIPKLSENMKDIDYVFQIPFSPYGGMFFHKNLIKTIGYPNDHLFIDYDDWDYTFRLTQRGGKIFLVLNSHISDLDIKLSQPTNFISRIKSLNRTNKFLRNRTYFVYRNKIYFEKKFPKNKMVYFSHLLFFSILYFISCVINFNLYNFKIYILGLIDGFQERFDREFTNKY